MAGGNVDQQSVGGLGGVGQRQAQFCVNLLANEVFDNSARGLGCERVGHGRLCFFWNWIDRSSKFPKFSQKNKEKPNFMLAIERQRRILDLLAEAGALRTAETAEALGVTDETVRKDFEVLEKRGELLRSHGGASLPEKIRGDVPFNERQAIRREEKKAIARVAAGRIRPNETIFLDASSTVLTLTEFLPIDMPLTVITNALNVINALADRPNLDLICTGGLHVAKSQSFVGLAAEKSLLRYHIHRMFLSGDGLHLERGLSESNSRQASFKERVIASAEDVVFLADHSKLGRKASYFFGEVGDLSCLVSDEKADAGFVADLQAMGVEVLLGNLDGAPSS
jgi:DeoR/GlpR family transcriptional regulator of sugar metabolism